MMHGNAMHQRNYVNMLQQAKYSANDVHQQLQDCSVRTPTRCRTNLGLTQRYPPVRRPDNHKSNTKVTAVDIAHVRAIRRMNLKNSLFPHGDPLPEDWIDHWDERPECPRPQWTYIKENPTWQPPVKNDTGDYSGTELIQARGDDVLTISYKPLTNFVENLRQQTYWQITTSTTKVVKNSRVARTSTSDYETGEGSDSSSVKSGSSVDFSPKKFLAALW